MSEALVIAITRMGDLVQSEPFCRALKAAGVEKVTLLTEEAFTPVAEMLEGADDVVSLRFADILPQLGRSPKGYPVAPLSELIGSLRKRGFAQVWNLTHTRPSMMLAAAIGGDFARGVTIDSEGRQVVRGEWLRYFFATNLARPWSVYNLVDVYINSARSDMPFEARTPRFKRTVRKQSKIREWSDPYVAIHLGASQRDKQWPVEGFQAVARSLLDRGARVVLIGGKGDSELAAQFTKHPRLSNRIGETPIRELVELLSNVDLLISADSGPVHIAAAVGAKVIAIEGGSAHGWETAPYGAGHWVLQPHLKYLMSRVPDKKLASASAASISVESVLTVIEASLDKRHVPVADQGCTIYETTSDGHNLSLEPRAGAMMQIDEWYSVLRRIWRAVLSRGVLSITLLDSPAGRCALTARGLSKVGVSNQCRLEELASRLRMEQEQLTAFLLKLPPLHALARYMEISLAAVEGATLRQQALESAEVFEQIAYGIDVLTREEKDRNQTIKHNNVREAACASI